MAEPAPTAALPGTLRARYRDAFRAYLAHRDEQELGIAYALGREAVSTQASLLELAEEHHLCTQEALRDVDDPDRRAELLAAAGTFFGEALSVFEITHRGYHEVQEVVRLEHAHVTQLHALAEASVRINAAMSTEEVLQLTVEAAQRLLGARRATISGLAGDPYVRALDAAAPASGPGPEPVGEPIGVMLRSAGRPLGALEVSDDPGRAFTPRDELILAQLGQLASVAIAKSQAYSRERHIAQVLQRSLLPPGIPALPGLAVAVRFIAAGEGIEVGGDFYDVFPARDDAIAALIGDVCGKGPEAASVTALARHTLRAAAAYEARPSAVLHHLHRALTEARDDGRFCTVAFCDIRLHTQGARVTLACGGHPLPLVLRATGAVEPVGAARHAARGRHRAGAHGRDDRARARRADRPLHGRRHGGARRPQGAVRPPRPRGAAGPLRRRARGIGRRARPGGGAEASGGRPGDDIAIVVLGPAPHMPVPGTLPFARRPTEDTDGR